MEAGRGVTGEKKVVYGYGYDSSYHYDVGVGLGCDRLRGVEVGSKFILWWLGGSWYFHRALVERSSYFCV